MNKNRTFKEYAYIKFNTKTPLQFFFKKKILLNFYKISNKFFIKILYKVIYLKHFIKPLLSNK